jgi:hypothetical protein
MKKLFAYPLTLLAICFAVISCEKDDSTILLPAPDGLREEININNRSAALSWETVSGADGYELIVGGVPYTAVAASITITSLVYNTDYTWKVRATKSDTYGDWSTTATFRLDKEEGPVTVPVPTGLQQQVGQTDATLSWRNVDVDSYEIDLNGTMYEATTNQKEFTDLTPGTNYAWKVRAKKNDVYSNWSATSRFQTSTPSFTDKTVGNWSTDNAVINLLLGTDQLNLDDLLGRTHTPGATVQVTIVENGGQPQMTVTGMDNYITGGEASLTTPFDIDGQLVNLPLTLNELASSVSTSKSINSNNVYKKYAHIKINTIPNYSTILGSMASFVANNYIENIEFRVTNVTITGTFGSQGSYSFVYEGVVSITTDIPQTILDFAGISDVSSMLPTPQKLLSVVVCTK